MKKLLLIFLCGYAVILSACRDKECHDISNPECENYDPCYAYPPANADFTIYEIVGDQLSETDTILVINSTLFKPKYAADKITWLIGSEVVSSKQLIRRNYPFDTWITVTMIAEVDSHDCRTSSDLKDTMTKRFYVYGQFDTTGWKNTPWWGTWKGYNEGESDEDILVSFGFISPNGTAVTSLAGLPKKLWPQERFYSGNPLIMHQGNVGWHIQTIKASSNNYWGGFAIQAIATIVDDNNSINITYSYNNTPYQHWIKSEQVEIEPINRVNKKYVGTKISNQVITK